MLDDHAHVMQVKLCKANTRGVTLRTSKMPFATSWHRLFQVSRSLVISWHCAFQPSRSFIMASRCFFTLIFITVNRTCRRDVRPRQTMVATKMSKGGWITYLSAPLSSWSYGPRAATGLAPIFYCSRLGDHTPRPHDCSPLRDGSFQHLSLHYSYYYQQRSSTCQL